MRKQDLELLEMHLEPLRTTKDRHESLINEMKRVNGELQSRVTELEKSETMHGLAIDQGLASIRSLLQRAHREARKLGMVEGDKDGIDYEEIVPNTMASATPETPAPPRRRVI